MGIKGRILKGASKDSAPGEEASVVGVHERNRSGRHGVGNGWQGIVDKAGTGETRVSEGVEVICYNRW